VSVGTAKLLLIYYSLSSVFIAHHSIAPPLTDVEFILTIGISAVGYDRGNNVVVPPAQRAGIALLHLHHIYDSQDHRFHAARGSSGHGVVVERVIEKSVMEITYPVLTRTNYSEWSLVMRVNLQAASLWDGIEDDTTDYREDRNALAALLRAVLEEMQVRLARNESASDAWEAIRAMHMGGECIKEANADKLRREFSDLQFKPGKCVEDFSLCVTALANQLCALGDKVSEKEEIKKLLHSVPDHLEQVAISIETLLDRNMMTIEEATGHPRVVEERKKKNTGGPKEGRMLLIEEEWMARLKVHNR
jgi:hypothetical protein